MISTKSFLYIVLLLLASLVAVVLISLRPKPVVVQTNLENLPMTIAGYTAVEDSFSESIYKELNADKHIYRHYKDQNGNQIDLYIGYYGTAKGGRTGHNPYACLPGGGSAIVETDKIYISQITTGNPVSINYILSRKNEINTIMFHWYQTAGKTVVSSGLRQNIERFKGRVLHNRNDGAFVQLTASTADGDLIKNKHKVEKFAEKILNLLPIYWPNER